MKTNRRTFLRNSCLLGGATALPFSRTQADEDFASLPAVPYGAVYFRQSSPPEKDWARDYSQAQTDGMNCFRHWFQWSAIERAPGEYDWSDFDRQFDLAAKHGIKTIVGEILSTAPQWAFDQFPEAIMEAADGSKVGPHYNVAAATGGWPGLCLDNEPVLARAEAFIRALVLRYREHPAMGGYDVWNELNHLADAGGCWCAASAAKFRNWLREKYGNLETLGEAWYRYSYTDWDQVRIPRKIGPFPDAIDFGLFRIDNAMRIFERRVKLIRELDPNHPVTNHTIPMRVVEEVFPATYPEGGSYPVFEATRLVDISGFSGGGNHDDRYPLRWSHWMKMDITRSATQGKPFWAAEMTIGNSWGMKNVEIDEGRITTAQDVRLFTLQNLAGGVRGFFSPRWRPLLDGPVFGSFAFYGMDGAPTERSEAAAEMIQWLKDPDHASLLAAKPVKSDIGILILPESQIHTFCSQGDAQYYTRCVRGAYRAMLSENLQTEFVPADAIPEDLEVLYLPFPTMLTKENAERIQNWVRQGGRLISEGCPGYFGDRGRAGTTQPNLGFDALFGVRQSFVQFTPDLLDELSFSFEDGTKGYGGVYLQAYEPTTAIALAKYEDGRIAVAQNTIGKGQATLVGTFPGYQAAQNSKNRDCFKKLFSLAGVSPSVQSTESRLTARLQQNPADRSRFLWIVNPTRTPLDGKFTLGDAWGPITSIDSIRGSAKQENSNRLEANVPARDVTILRLD